MPRVGEEKKTKMLPGNNRPDLRSLELPGLRMSQPCRGHHREKLELVELSS